MCFLACLCAGGESHWIDTGCGSARGRSLCCKTDAELRGFVAWADAHITGQGVRWWCHLDDDNYVLLGPLRQFLSELRQPDAVPYYVGRAGPTKSGNRLHAPFAMGTQTIHACTCLWFCAKMKLPQVCS